MSKWSKAAILVSGVRDGLVLLDDDERRRAIEALRSIVYEDMFGTGSRELLADACVRCGSIGIVRRRCAGSGDQRWYCKDCKRTFMVNIGRVLGMSKLPVETWMTYMEAFIDQLPLRDCMDKCGAGPRTAWYMSWCIIECIQRYNPSFNAVARDRVEIDETYFRDSYKGYRKGAMPCPARKSGKKAAKRGQSKQQVCVVTGIDDTGASFLVVSGRGMLGKERAYKALVGRIGKGALVVTDKAGAYPASSNASARRWNARTRPSKPSTASTACTPGSRTSCTVSRACPRSTSSPTSHGSSGPRCSRAPLPSSGALPDARSATACTVSRAACTCACPCPCDGR